jgi:acyl dehydratase
MLRPNDWIARCMTTEQYQALVGETFSKEVLFDAAGIAEFARLCGDTNPLHHNATYAAGSRFGGIIASGPQVTSLLMAMIAAFFAPRGPGVGLGFNFRLRSAVRAGETVTMRWRVTAVRPKRSLGGHVISLEGEAVRPDGAVAVAATGEVLGMDAP